MLSYQTASTAAPISAVRFRHSSRRPLNATQFVYSGTCRENRSWSCLRPQIAARCPDVPRRPGRVLTIARLPRFYNSSVFRATDLPPTRRALLTANWRGRAVGDWATSTIAAISFPGEPKGFPEGGVFHDLTHRQHAVFENPQTGRLPVPSTDRAGSWSINEAGLAKRRVPIA